MKYKLSHLLILLFLTISFTFAQRAPGYIGKRINIHGMFQAKYSLLNPTKDGSAGVLSFNKQYGIGLEYAINKRTSMIATFQTYTTSKSYEEEFYSPDYSVYINMNEVYAKLNTNSFSLEYRKYPFSLAPMGGFIGYIINYKTIDLRQPKQLKSLPSSERPFNQSPYSLVSLGLSLGKQRIFFNCLAVSGSVNFLLPLELGKMGYFRNLNSDKRYNESYEVYRRILNHDMFNLKMSVGLLL